MTILRVGKDSLYKTINDAYNVAYTGDVILIDEGVYEEQLVMDNKYVHLVGNTRTPERGKVIISPQENQNVLYFSNIQSIPTIYIEGIHLKLNVAEAGGANEVIEVFNCLTTNIIFNKCIINASFQWEYVFQCNGNDLASITLNNCRIVWKDDKEYDSAGAHHFVREAVDVNFIISKSVFSNHVENINTTKFTTSQTFDYVLKHEQLGYGPYYSTYQCSVPIQYYFEGTITDIISEGVKLDTATLIENNKVPEIVLSNGDLRASLLAVDAGIHRGVKTTFGKTIGKWYWEVKPYNYPNIQLNRVGVGSSFALLINPVGGIDGESFGLDINSGNFYYKNQSNSCSENIGYNDIIGIALDLFNGKIWWSINGVWVLEGNPSTGENPVFDGLVGEFFPMISLYTSYFDAHIDVIFSPEDLIYPIPYGFEFYSSSVTWDIKLFNSNTNLLVNQTLSMVDTNSYYITTTHSGEHFIVCEDADSSPNYNDLIFSRMIPKEFI